MAALFAAGAELNRTLQFQHGATGTFLGVSLKILGKMQKRINRDHLLARWPLWM
jgi:hypothetical protein